MSFPTLMSSFIFTLGWMFICKHEQDGWQQTEQLYAYLEGSCTNISQIFACLLNTSTLVHVHTSSSHLWSLNSAVGGKKEKWSHGEILFLLSHDLHRLKYEQFLSELLYLPDCLCTVVTIGYELPFLLTRKRDCGKKYECFKWRVYVKSLIIYSVM